jgi:flavin reductase (DIM6/NTAB) family NADH-FMN oxidoreductase RutF
VILTSRRGDPGVGRVKVSRPRKADPVKRVLNPKMLYFGTPVLLVSSLNADGTTNQAPMSWSTRSTGWPC